MKTELEINTKGGNTTVGVINEPNDYLLWQISNKEKQKIYFEYEDQANGGYDIVQECSADYDGMHLVLNSGELVHFYFNDFSSIKYLKLAEVLKEIYLENPRVLEILDL